TLSSCYSDRKARARECIALQCEDEATMTASECYNLAKGLWRCKQHPGVL
ncbi:hypothetical protein DAEQUDRAFT_729440, partial [Daedalea quercina L-15889]